MEKGKKKNIKLQAEKEITLWIQKPNGDTKGFKKWTGSTDPRQHLPLLRSNTQRQISP
jgi:hypothetical protein